MRTIGLAALFVSLFFIPTFVFASEKIVVTPAFQELVLDAHQSILGEIEIQNQTTTSQEFTVRSVSFDALDTSGGVAFLGTDINDESLPAAPFVFFENKTLSVPAGATAKFSFEVRDLPTLSPGGHYAALIFQSLPVTDQDSAKKIAVRQIFSTLIFLEKKGGAIKDLQLRNPFDKYFVWALPKTLELHFANKGNTHVVPRGTVVLRDFLVRTHACGSINESSSILLPGQERVLPVSLKCKPVLPGLYTLLVSHRYDGKEEVTTIAENFVFIPYQFIFAGGGALVLLLLLKKRGLHRRTKNL